MNVDGGGGGDASAATTTDEAFGTAAGKSGITAAGQNTDV